MSTSWQLSNVTIAHNIIEYHTQSTHTAKNDSEYVRLHFGLQGSYDFSFAQLNSSFSLSGHHNNIIYADGLEIEVKNKSKRIETLGINFDPTTFIEIGQYGNEPLKRFTDKVINKKDTILSSTWNTSNFKIQQAIHAILNCTYKDGLKELFLLSKSIELLVLQAELFEQKFPEQFITSEKDKKRLIEARALLKSRIDNPPTITELSKLTGINEYKLKKGFKEQFGTTIFGYTHGIRMDMAKDLLLETDKTAKEIAFETGYSSPQHFSKAFKTKFGHSPNSIRNTPDIAINASENPSNLQHNHKR